MDTQFSSFKVENYDEFKNKLIAWASQFPVFIFLDSNHYTQDPYSKFDFVIGIDVIDQYQGAWDVNSFKEWLTVDPNMVLGYFGYEMRHPHLSIKKQEFPSMIEEDFFWIKPRYLVYGKDDRIYFQRNYPEAIEWMDAIQATIVPSFDYEPIHLCSKTSRREYEANVQQIKDRIREGDFYEMNYCLQFEVNQYDIDPIAYFIHKNKEAKAPMTALIKNRMKYTLSYSPERFLAHRDGVLIAQPIKGTAKRDLMSPLMDQKIKEDLEQNEKERAENLMIVDLMRNDLSNYAAIGTIRVPELCAIYSFERVHQMISTITATLSDSSSSIEAFLESFPPGSMTGAPKKEVVQQLTEIENFTRGLYSGSIGYIDVGGDYDFNVVIRTFFYDKKKQQATVSVGSAITYLSEAAAEWEECLIKAQSIFPSNVDVSIS